MTKVHQIISDTTLTYHQMMLALARLAESEDFTSLPRSEEELQAMKDGILCDLNEGLVPYRPRYIIPDYMNWKTKLIFAPLLYFRYLFFHD